MVVGGGGWWGSVVYTAFVCSVCFMCGLSCVRQAREGVAIRGAIACFGG